MEALWKLTVSLLLGCLTGLLYGLSFLSQGKKALSSLLRSVKSAYAQLLFLTLSRILAFGASLYFLLLMGTIHFILFLVSFLATFWIIILKQKV